MYYWHSWSEKKKKFSRAILSTNVRFIWLNFELLRVLNLIFCCQNTDVESKWQGNAQIGQKDNYVCTCILKLATVTKVLFTFQEVIVNIRLFQTFFSNSLYYLSLYRNEDEKTSSSSTNSSSSRPRVERSSSTRIANAAKLLRQHLRYLPIKDMYQVQ